MDESSIIAKRSVFDRFYSDFLSKSTYNSEYGVMDFQGRAPQITAIKNYLIFWTY